MSSLGSYLIAIVSSILLQATLSAQYTLQTPIGDITGLRVEYKGKKIDQFLGIPFGVVNARFTLAEPTPALGTFNATQQPPGCIQVKIIRKGHGKSPLYLH